MLPADPGARQPRVAVGRPARGRARLRGVGSLALPAGAEAAGGGDFGAAWGGIASVQLALPVVWTYGRERGCSLADVARWMAAVPAKTAGLAAKGAIAVGRDADLVAFAPDAEFVVTPDMLRHRHKLTPYLGQRLDRRRQADVAARPGRSVGGAPQGSCYDAMRR